MTTTRSLLRDAVSAGWISWKLQRLNSARLIRSSRLACFLPRCSLGCEGRITYPCLRASEMLAFASASDALWQTTRVLPGPLPLSADASERAFGTFPPAAGWTEVSGRGLGQQAVRSTCATAVPYTASRPA